MPDEYYFAAPIEMTLAGSARVLIPTLICVAVAAVVHIVYRGQRRKKVPLVVGGKIKKILIYPFKSLSALEVDTAELTFDGLIHKTVRDR